MIEMTLFALLLAGVWGTLYALWLQRTRTGAFMAARMTWLSVVIGCGANLLIALLVMEVHTWLVVVGVFVASGIPIVIRSLTNEHRLQMDVMNGAHDAAGE